MLRNDNDSNNNNMTGNNDNFQTCDAIHTRHDAYWQEAELASSYQIQSRSQGQSHIREQDCMQAGIRFVETEETLRPKLSKLQDTCFVPRPKNKHKKDCDGCIGFPCYLTAQFHQDILTLPSSGPFMHPRINRQVDGDACTIHWPTCVWGNNTRT